MANRSKPSDTDFELYALDFSGPCHGSVAWSIGFQKADGLDVWLSGEVLSEGPHCGF
ncbi:hypothetical protein RESH_05310 [Rhodopirellula europaea SH398]|uniref:Uncharacterized protein n=1 Tax=Rhodopirellula europaea SH398 TaxID=1263868 RepID=M5SD85_9BACT|nr:hypothetical protein RESH_05310 [Rhodopirellula europaea SH398]